jgi:hypothetical protein
MTKRTYGTGHLYEKSGSFYGHWRMCDGRQLNGEIGPIPNAGEGDGLTRAQAEREFRRLQDAEERAPKPVRGLRRPTVDEVGDSLPQVLRLGGCRSRGTDTDAHSSRPCAAASSRMFLGRCCALWCWPLR